jgi:hypothetical protein
MISDIRQWIMLCEGNVQEVGNPPYRVYRNPSSNALTNLIIRSRDKILKGLYEPSTGIIYVWDAYQAVHTTVEYDLGLPYAGTGNDPVSLILGLNDDGRLALHVCDDRAIGTVTSHPSFHPIKFDDPDQALRSRWQ